MLCIFAFIVFLILFPILGFFPEYRRLFGRSWECVFKKVTLQPCDINLGAELKNKLLGKFVFKYPKTVKFFDKTFSFWAFLFVALNIWSLVYAGLAGLNLWVYDTCDPVSGEGCSLSGEACGVASTSISFDQAVNEGKLGEWAAEPFTTFADTVSKVPDRFTNWEPKNYLPSDPSYYQKYDDSKKTALEAIDPSCVYCAKLFENIKTSKFYEKYNLTFLIYPIPSPTNSSGYRFQHSYMMSRYVEATKKVDLNDSQVSGEWQLIEKFFTAKGDYNEKLQDDFKSTFDKTQAEDKIKSLLKEIGYSEDQVSQISTLAGSDEVKNELAKQKDIVENKIRTIKIPTIMFNGRRFDRVVDADYLSKN
jgi:hypothetical protein